MNRRGFTLIEVLVALAIAAIGLGAALSVVTNATANTVYLRDRVLAAWIAENRLTEMRIGPNLPSVDSANGTVEYATRRWQWTSTVTQTGVDGLLRIEVTVRDEANAAGSPLASLVGFAGRTAQAGGASMSGDPFDPHAMPTTGGLPVVPATPAIPGQPSVRVQ